MQTEPEQHIIKTIRKEIAAFDADEFQQNVLDVRQVKV